MTSLFPPHDLAQEMLSRRSALTLTATACATPFLPAFATPASPIKPVEWKMVTSWPKNSPGPGVTAQRLADRITQLSGGRLTIKVFGAGEMVPALEVFDAVSRGTAELGHTASFFWRGKVPASVFFTTVPFGLTATEHLAWIYHGGGQALWDELYAPFGIKAWMAGNTGMSMGGWFKRELTDLSSLKGLKYRIPGLAGEMLRRLGATPMNLPPSEIFAALQSGVIDGAELLGPWSDLGFGLFKAAPYYYWPGFHEPNGTGECLIHRPSLEKLSPELQLIIENACATENAYSLAESEWHNAIALEKLVREHNVQLRTFPTDILLELRRKADEVLADFAKSNPLEQRIYQSYEGARRWAMQWSRVSTEAFLKARSGE